MAAETSGGPTSGLVAWANRDSTGGLLLILATTVALVAANTGLADAYTGLRDSVIGPTSLHLDLSLGTWAADGLLAVFFFVVGLELKREVIAGALSDRRRAIVPVAAAIGGVVLPVALYLGVVSVMGGGAEARAGWAVPAATDIAFAVTVIAVVGRHLPASLRMFLLTLAVVDDLIAISIIALFFTDGVHLIALVGAGLAVAVFALVVRRWPRWWVLAPVALLVWVLVHEAGIHATIAGVLLGVVVPVFDGDRPPPGSSPEQIEEAGEHGPAARLEHAFSPWSSTVAVPVFAFLAAGVHVGGVAGLGEAVGSPVAVGIIVALVAGKTLGILGGAFLITRVPGVHYSSTLTWSDILGAAMLGGIGFTVSLLVGELAFGEGSALTDQMKVGVLVGSLLAAGLAALLLTWRDRHYAQISRNPEAPARPASSPRT